MCLCILRLTQLNGQFTNTKNDGHLLLSAGVERIHYQDYNCLFFKIGVNFSQCEAIRVQAGSAGSNTQTKWIPEYSENQVRYYSLC